MCEPIWSIHPKIHCHLQVLTPPIRTVVHQAPETALSQHTLRKIGSDSQTFLRVMNQSWRKHKVLQISTPKVTLSLFNKLTRHVCRRHDRKPDLTYSRLNSFINIRVRLCIVEPSNCILRLLAFVHSLYHALKNDPRGAKVNAFSVSPNSMPAFASEISSSSKYTNPTGTP